jgi:hypothetical protein
VGLAGLAMVVFSFFPWAEAKDDALSVAVTGLGSVSFEATEQRAQELGAGVGELTEQIEDRSNAPGAYMVILGLALASAATALVSNRYPGLGAAAGLALSLIAVFLSLEYLFAPGDAVLDGSGSTGVGYAGVGLWLVTAASIGALLATVTASIWSLRTRSGVSARYRRPPSPRPESRSWPEPGYRDRPGDTGGHLERRPDVLARRATPYHRPGEPRQRGPSTSVRQQDGDPGPTVGGVSSSRPDRRRVTRAE